MGVGLSTELEYNSLYQETLDELDTALRRVRNSDKELTELDLSNRFLGIKGAQHATEALSRTKYLRSLDLSYNNLGHPYPKKRTNSKKDENGVILPPIEQKPLKPNEIGMFFLVEGLATNQSLHSLSLGGNNLRLDGATHVAKVLTHNGTLRELSLFNNGIGDDSIPALCNALRENTRLTKLNLDYNDITDEGAKLLAEMLNENRNLIFLSLKNNSPKLSSSWIKAIEECLARNRSMQTDRDKQEREAEEREREKQEDMERDRQQKEVEIRAERERIEKEYRVIDDRRKAEEDEAAKVEQERQLRLEARRQHHLAKQIAQEEHVQNLVQLAYEWRATLRGGKRRGREWRCGFTSFKDIDVEYGAETDPLTMSAIQQMQSRRLQACWCEPTEQTVPYSGVLHYHCIYEPSNIDQLIGADGNAKYDGCRATPHKCRSMPLAQSPQGGQPLF